MADQTPPPHVPHGTGEGLVLDDAVFRIDKGRTERPLAGETESHVPHVEHIPWGYGRDRITAMVVDPNRLYIYWELTDPSIEKARQALGAGGKDAWLSLRVYDITGRIFDGTNAHSYFDLKIDRSDRQWFVHIGKPASSHVVEVGLKSYEGYFTKVMRSGRADFPRFEPSADGTVDWLTVRNAIAPVGGPSGGSTQASEPPRSSPGEPHSGSASPGGQKAVQDDASTEMFDGAVRRSEWSRTAWHQLFHTKWQDLFHGRWVRGRQFSEGSTPVMRSTWQAGPFPAPVPVPGMTEEHFDGPVTVVPLNDGRTRIVFGPWQVIVRGMGARAERKVVSRWEMEASWVVDVGYERVVRELSPAFARDGDHGEAGLAPALLGGSEALGASERRWLSASELRMRGASELYMLGASEIRMRGASEVLVAGASERRILGGSERVFRGASESRLAGGSETVWLGASERPLGSSERSAGRTSIDSPYAIDELDKAPRREG